MRGAEVPDAGALWACLCVEIASAVWTAMDQWGLPLDAAREVVFDNGHSWTDAVERVYRDALADWYRERAVTTGRPKPA